MDGCKELTQEVLSTHLSFQPKDPLIVGHDLGTVYSNDHLLVLHVLQLLGDLLLVALFPLYLLNERDDVHYC